MVCALMLVLDEYHPDQHSKPEPKIVQEKRGHMSKSDFNIQNTIYYTRNKKEGPVY